MENAARNHEGSEVRERERDTKRVTERERERK